MGKNFIWMYDLQYYIGFEETEGEWDFVKVTEDRSFDPSRDATTYEASYLCERDSTEYTQGHKDSYEFEIDAASPGGIQKALALLEDECDAPVMFLRTCAWDFSKDAACPADALVAKRRPGRVNLEPFQGAHGEPFVIKGKVTFDSGSTYEHGTFDPSTKKFTPAGSGTVG